jgi:hypothetical protein
MAQKKKVDLADVFQMVTQTLAENQQGLNQADTYNQDHGTNMVQTFQTISGALQEKKGKSSSQALNYAARRVAKSTHSGSGQLYAQNLAQAARKVKGKKKIDPATAMQLLQTLIGGGQEAPRPEVDPLAALQGGQAGASAGRPQAGAPLTGGGDALASLLGGLMGGGASGQSGSGDLLGSAGGQGGLPIEALLNAGLALMQGSQGGQNKPALESLLPVLAQVLASRSGMGQATHRNQSTQLVANAFLQALAEANRRS